MAGSTDPNLPGPLSRRRFLGASAGAAASAAAISLIPAVASAADGSEDGHGRNGELTVLPANRGIILYTVRDVVTRTPNAGHRRERRLPVRLRAAVPDGLQVGRVRRLQPEHQHSRPADHRGGDPSAARRQRVDRQRQPHRLQLRRPGLVPGSAGHRRDARHGAPGYRGHPDHQPVQVGLGAGGNPTAPSGLRGLEYFFTLADPRLVWFEMDIFWGYVAQHRYQTFTDKHGRVRTAIFDPIKTVKQHSHRFPLFHVKTQTFPVTDPGGAHRLFLVFQAVPGGPTSALFNLNWMEFVGTGVAE